MSVIDVLNIGTSFLLGGSSRLIRFYRTREVAASEYRP